MKRISFLLIFFAFSCTLSEKETRKKIPKKISAILNDTSKFVFNYDYLKRDQVLGINTDWEKTLGGIEYFEGIKVGQIEELLVNRFIDPSEYQNESPSTKEFYKFMKKYPDVIAHGYAVSPERNDYRVTIEGLYVEKANVTRELKKEFYQLCKDADEYYDDDELYSWWD